MANDIELTETGNPEMKMSCMMDEGTQSKVNTKWWSV